MAFVTSDTYGQTPKVKIDGDWISVQVGNTRFTLSREEAWILITDMKRDLSKAMTDEEVAA